MRLPRARSLRIRFSLVVIVAVLIALSVTFLVVVRSLRQNLVDNRLTSLQRVAEANRGFIRDQVVGSPGQKISIEDLVGIFQLSGADVSVVSQDRVSLLTGRPATDLSSAVTDTLAETSVDAPVRTGTVGRLGALRAQAAFPGGVDGRTVAIVLTQPLGDVDETVGLVRDRILFGGAFAILAALVAGLLAANPLVLRLRRLEAATRRVAGGDFRAAVTDRGQDEIGELALALREMRDRLAQLDDARRTFISTASHELRTPLFSLGGSLELIEEGGLSDAERAEFLATMRQQVDRLTKLATDLLDLSRIDAGALQVRRQPVALGQLANEMATEFFARAEEHHSRLVVDVPPDEDVVALADESRVAQVLRALIDNALLHTPPGSAVRVAARTDDESRVSVSVADDGPGIPAEARARVFERFQRGDADHVRGSGLGLAIARELAERMDGRLTLEAQEPDARGATFTLELPGAPVLVA